MSYIKIRNLSKVYENKSQTVESLKKINCDIKLGEFTAVTGHSGSGKSTLLNIIGGMNKATSGSVIVNDVDITKFNRKELSSYRRNKVSFIHQMFNLINNLNCEENVKFAMEASGKKDNPTKYLKLVGLDDMGAYYPDELSGGQQQRVAIARAIAKNSEILLCDEPTGALDYENGKKVVKLLHSLKSYGCTIIVVTHNFSIAEAADHHIMLRDGSIILDKKIEDPLKVDMLFW